MNTFDKSGLQEPESEFSPPAHDSAISPDSPASANKPGDTRKSEGRPFTHSGKAIRSWFTANTFSPAWLPERWSHPTIGYLVALLLQVIAVFIMNLIVQLFPSFRFPEALVILGVLIVSLGWGVGPGILATLFGTLLLVFLIFPPYFSFALARQEDSAAVVLYTVVGLTISIMAGQTERARRTSENLRVRLDTIIDAIPDALTIYDVQGARTRVNPAAQEMLGEQVNQPYLSDEALRLRDARTLTGETLKLAETPIARALRGDVVQALENCFRDAQEQERIVATSAVPLRGPQGNIEGAVVISHDITEMRQTELEVSSRIGRLEAIFEAIADAVFIYDTDGRVIQMNGMARTMLALDDPADYQGMSLQERAERMSVPDENGQLRALPEWPQVRVLNGEVLSGTKTRDIKLRGMDGHEFDINVSGAPIRDGEGTITGGVLICRDVTERLKMEQRLRESERAAVENVSQLEALFETMVDAVVVYDRTGKFVRMNSATRRLLGIDAQPEYVVQNLPDRMERIMLRDDDGKLLPEEQWPHYRILRGGEILTGANIVDLTVLAMDGVERQVSLSGAPIRAADGQIVGAICVVRDVTRRRHLERELAARAQELETIFDTMNDGVCVYDRSGRVLQANRAAHNLLGIDARPSHFFEQPVVERSSFYIMYDAQGNVLPVEEGPVLRVLSGENLHINAFDIQIDQPEGRTVYLNVSGAPVRDEQGIVTGAVCVYRDLSERRRLEQRTQETLDALLSITGAFISTEDTTDNEQAEEATKKLAFRLTELACRVLNCREGAMAQLLPGTDVTQLLASVGLSQEQEHTVDAMVQGTHLRERYEFPETFERLSAGEVVEIDLTRQPHRDRRPNTSVSRSLVLPLRQHDRLIGVIALSRTDASRKLSPEEMALAQAVAKFAVVVIDRAQLMRERADAQAQALALQVANQRMDAFLGIASHELKTPLTTIKGNVQLAQRQMKRWLRDGLIQNDTLRSRVDDVQLMLERAERQVGVQNRLVSDLLDVSRIQANKLEIRLEPCDLVDIVKAAVEDQQYAAETRTIIVEQEVASLPILADADRIGQVVSNYLTNALKYSPADAPVTVTVQVQGQFARVSVRDEGPGLPPAEQERIWERFYRSQGVEVRSGSGVGLGLGLHICRTIIEQHHGNVGVSSAQGKGATFWFTLPLKH